LQARINAGFQKMERLDKRVAGNLTRFYVVALFVVALLTVSGLFLVRRTIRNLNHDSRIVNVAGRQRMLSQRLTKLAILKVNGIDHRDSVQFNTLLSLWKDSHEDLVSRRLPIEKGFVTWKSQPLDTMFHELTPVFDRIHNNLLVIDRDNDRLYELYRAFKRRDGGWDADSGAVFHLDKNNVRPTAGPGWTSADAAGLPIFPGLARYDEASTGVIAHALRFTVERSRRAYVPPATHWASSSDDPDLPPMGMRVRLKAAYRIPAGFSRETKAILKALKSYGMFVADNGSDWFLSGAPDGRWKNDRLVSELRQVTGSNFEVVRMEGVVTP